MNGPTLVLDHVPADWLAWAYAGAALVLAWWVWRRYGPAPAGTAGVVAKTCRAAAMVALVGLVAGPSWRLVEQEVTAGHLAVAIDRSLSMARHDGPGGAPRLVAATALYRALAADTDPERLRLSWHLVGGGVEPVNAEAVPGLEASGEASPLGRELATLGQEVAPDLLVVVSDGRVSTGPTLEAAARRLRDAGVEVWSLAVGSEAIDPELRLDDVRGPAEVALDERQPFELVIGGRALPNEPLRLRLELGDRLLDQRELPSPASGDDLAQVELRGVLEAVLSEPGEHRLRFTVEQGPLSATVTRTVRATERKLRVLLLAHRPRYELRYLRAALDRDPTVTLAAYLADGRWRRWGDGPERIPLSPGELAPIDAVILGDLPPDALPPTAQEALVTAVREGGTGFLWLPGETGATAGFRSTPLGQLLPVRLGGADTIARGYLSDRPIQPRRTEAARSRGLLEPEEGAWSDLPALRGAAAVDGLRGNAQALIEDGEGRPLVVSADYGNGRAVFLAVDDTWRWRRQVGDIHLHRFHSLLLRHVSARRNLNRAPWRIEATPARVRPGGRVVLSVLAHGTPPDGDALPDRVVVVAERDDGRELWLPLERSGESPGWRTDLPAPAVGSWNLRLAEGLPPRTVTGTEVTVLPPLGEFRDPRRDRPALAALAEGTGGALYDTAAELVAALPSLARERELEERRPLWDGWWSLAVVVLLLAVEWSIRRLSRLP